MSREQSALLVLSLSIGLALAVDICEYQMDGVRLSHPADCNKFVECRNGRTVRITSCPLGLHFNRFKGVCDLRQRAACDIEFIHFLNEETNCSACCARYGCYVRPECAETPGTTTAMTTLSTSLMPETTSSVESTEATPAFSTTAARNTTNVPVTSSSPSTPDIPDTTSTPASSYSTETSTSPGSSGAPSSSFSTEATSSSTTPETYSPSTPATTSSSISAGTPTSSSTSETPSSLPTPVSPETPATPDTPQTNECPNSLTVCQNVSANSTMHVNGTCNQYIVCVAGCAYIMSCPANLQYDIGRQECDYPQNVNCPWQSTTSVTGPSGVACAHHGQCERQPDGQMFASPNTNGYIVCQCECEVERPCPQGTKFDAKLLTCAWQANTSESGNGNGTDERYPQNAGQTTEDTHLTVCRNNVEICRNQTEGKLLPVDGICNRFYKCNFGCAIEILCPNNLIYNPQVEYCDYPYNYKCPWPFTPPSGPLAGPSGIECASGGRCVNKVDGTLLPSYTSCAKYVVCQCECEVERECAKNLYWDRNLLTCNYASNVTCEIDL